MTGVSGERVVPTGCAHDCGGKCLLYVHVRDGKVVRITAPAVLSDNSRRVPQTPCIRGLRYQRRLYHPERLKHPMVRAGERGKGEFRRASWDEALDTVARELERIRESYGNTAIVDLSRTGSTTSTLHNTRNLAKRFLNMFGGCVELTGSYSRGAAMEASLYTYGTTQTDHGRDDLLNSKLIILWGWNPLETVFGNHTGWHLGEAKTRGAKIVCIDPRRTLSARLAHQWIPIRPGTDVAMLSAMAHTIITEGLHDHDFLATHTVGFDAYEGYILGREDGQPKTPEWAERITLVPAAATRSLAREYATTKPAALMPGYGPQRTAYGEQFTRATATLAALTGNIGVKGGNPAGVNIGPGPRLSYPPAPENPTRVFVPSYLWPDMILRGEAGGYSADVKMAYVVGGNLLNQQGDINKSVRALKKLEFIVVHEQFMTPTAKFADVLLPACTWMERNDILIPWDGHGDLAIFQNKAVEPLYESRTDLDVLTDLADRLGFKPRFNGKTQEEWLREIAGELGIQDFEGFRARGFHLFNRPEPHVAFAEETRGLKAFLTPSGKIEIYSERLAALRDPETPAIPKYIEPWEGPSDPLTERYSLQLITPQGRYRINSTMDNVPWDANHERSLWINPSDAEPRGVSEGDLVRVFNERGASILRARVTEDVMAGVVCMFNGAWYSPDVEGVDWGGSANVLTSGRPTPLAKASTQHTSLVQVEGFVYSLRRPH